MSLVGAPAWGMAAEHKHPRLLGNRGSRPNPQALEAVVAYRGRMPAVCRQSDIGGRFLRRGTLGGHEFAPVGWLHLHPSCVSGSVNMSPNNVYRSNAQDCLRMAQPTPDERDKPLWLTVAHSSLALA